jgi:hypothetical protein
LILFISFLCVATKLNLIPNTVPNADEENRERNKNFVAEVRAYLEEQKSKSETERNARQISGGKY